MQAPQEVQSALSVKATPFTMLIPPFWQTSAQVPSPRQPSIQSLFPPAKEFLKEQPLLPTYSNLSLHLSPPAHLTTANVSAEAVKGISKIFAISSFSSFAVAPQSFILALPSASAFAKSAQPAKPQPPQFAPASLSETALTFSSSFTAQSFETTPKITSEHLAYRNPISDSH